MRRAVIGKMFKKSGGDAGDGVPEAELINDGSHTKVSRRGDVIDALIKTDNVTERESKILLDELTLSCRESDGYRLMIDFAMVQILTSAGIGTLVTLHKRMHESGGGIAIYNLSDEIEQLLKLTRMDRLFPISTDRAAAYKAVR